MAIYTASIVFPDGSIGETEALDLARKEIFVSLARMIDAGVITGFESKNEIARVKQDLNTGALKLTLSYKATPGPEYDPTSKYTHEIEV